MNRKLLTYIFGIVILASIVFMWVFCSGSIALKFVLTGILFILIIIVYFLFIERQRDHQQISRIVELVKAGKLSSDMTGGMNSDLIFMYNQLAEIVAYYRNFNESIFHLSNSVIETVDDSNDLATCMLAANSTVSKGAEKQARDTELSLVTIATLSEKFDNVFKAVNVTEEQIQSLNRLSITGNENMSVSVKRSNDTRDTFLHVLKTVERLKESANNVNQIVTAITDITDRTNLLSLNASIEAARAGESGRGFAVVADEIRKLSDQSTDATQQIVDIVAGIKKEIESTTGLIENSAGIIEEQLKSVSGVGLAFKNMSENVENVVEQQSLVRKNMGELQAIKNSLIQALSSISEVAQESSATSEEATSMNLQLKQSSEMIFDLAEKLKKTIELVNEHTRKFEVKKIEQQRIKIVFVSLLPEKHQFVSKMVENAKKTAKRYDYDIKVYSPDTAVTEEQIKILEAVESEELNFLIIVVSSKELVTPFIQRLHNKGVKTICIDSDAPNSERISYIGTDNYAAGCTMGNMIAKYLRGKGNTIISAPDATWENMKARIKGITDTLKTYPEIKIVAIQSGFADPAERSKDLVRLLKEHPECNLIAGINAGFTLALKMVSSKVNLKDIIVLGFDNIADNIEALKNELLDAVVAQRQDIFAELAIKCIYDYINGREVKEIEMLDTYEINKINFKVLVRSGS